MALNRREVLKMFGASPFIGMFGDAPASGKESKSRDSGRTGNEQTWRVFEEPYLSEIAFPLGGIGTGTVSLGGRGDLRDWEVCNRPAKGRTLENTGFALWFQEEGSSPKAHILESQIRPPYRGAFGLGRENMPGMPRFENARFFGAYPFSRLELWKDSVPLDVRLEAFNPFIPGNADDSGLPVAIFYWHLRNRSRKKLTVTVLFSMLNIAGIDRFGKNLNRFRDEDTLCGIFMTTEKFGPEDIHYGNLAILSPCKDVTYLTRWSRGGWFDDQTLFWKDFVQDGLLDRQWEEGPSPDERTDMASLGLRAVLEPNECRTFPFLLTWYFPRRENYWNSEPEVKGKILKNYYATRFHDAWEVGNYVYSNLDRLENETRLFHRALFRSTLPPEVLDAVSSQMSTIRTNTCFRTDDGYFYGFEGTGDTGGCCPMNCTHVWNYEQALAHLFPALERTMRVVDFCYNTEESGHMAFRTLIPLSAGVRWKFKPAADGQMGTIVKLYREWLLSGDLDFLKQVWPGAKRALECAWKDWDPDQDGVMTGEQHNTYDIEFYGPNPMMGAIYLTALLAGAELAEVMGENESAARYREIYRSGREQLDNALWNGEYYIQVYDPAEHRKYQLGDGCLSDQLLGQWMAHVVGLGYVLPEEHVKSAINAVFKYNFRETMSEHENPQRIYALADESGLLLCTWPRGNKPDLPFVYSDEVWTGIEYQVAAHLIYEGRVQEGLRIVAGARNRYDGQRRNPWDEVECGHHYVRAMSGWSLLSALSGFHYHAAQERIAFRPVVHERRFDCFWSVDSGWGVYRQRAGMFGLHSEMEALQGQLRLRTIGLPPIGRKEEGDSLVIKVECGERLIDSRGVMSGKSSQIELQEAIVLTPGQILTLEIRK
ncbi:MAG TPA: GH116 family glycosyl-hydrolase [bacterium]|nr:GH116 family glycosyl-hydrolase [bacterium]HQL63792.1 GH116 family glycosyl-hydrolase [bacterium]